jgi:hypothetical protein
LGPDQDGGLAAAYRLEPVARVGDEVPLVLPEGDDPGEWRPDLPAFVSDPFAWVAKVRPFLTAAFVHTARAFFGPSRIHFTVHSNATNADRSYSRLTDPIKDTINARVWLGIHFRSADVQGAGLGRDVAHWVDDHFFQPVSHHRD